MKILAILLGTLVGLNAHALHARVAAPEQNALIANVRAQSVVGTGNVIGGTVTVDIAQNKVALVLLTGAECTARNCPHVAPTAALTEASIVAVENREGRACNAIVYTAQEDRRPVDGALTTIKVTAYVNSDTCPNRIPAPTVVELSKEYYSRMNGNPVRTEAVILADKLVKLAQ